MEYASTFELLETDKIDGRGGEMVNREKVEMRWLSSLTLVNVILRFRFVFSFTGALWGIAKREHHRATATGPSRVN